VDGFPSAAFSFGKSVTPVGKQPSAKPDAMQNSDFSTRRATDPAITRAMVPASTAKPVCGVLFALACYSAVHPAAARSLTHPFDWDGPQPNRANSAWRATVIPAHRSANPAWTATITYIRPEPRVPTTALAAIPRRSVPATRARSAPVTGPGGHALDRIASYYWQDQMTASGERFNRAALTAAHKTLPIGTRVRVTNVVNGRSVIVRINDRGPFKPGRVIDLSEAAARVIDMERFGLVPVKVDVLGGRG